MTETNDRTSEGLGEQYWVWVAEYLDAELADVDDPERRRSVMLDLFRILYDRLERNRNAYELIDQCLESSDEAEDVVWEAFRAASGRDSRARLRTLELLSRVLQDPEDEASCLLDMAALLEKNLEDPEGAAEKRARAVDVAPESRATRWSRLVDALAKNDDAATLEHLEALEKATEDGLWGATLLAERIAVLREGGSQGWELEGLLDELLNRETLDWPLVNEALASSEEFELWEIHARARKIMAERALTEATGPVPGRPEGHSFDGFERGAAVAAGQLWLLAAVRERKLEDRDGALSAIEEALAVAPEDPFLRMERSRILESMGRYSEALEGLPDEAPASWKAELCIASGNLAIVPDFVRAAELEGDSAENLVLMEVASGQEVTDDGAGEIKVSVSAGWLASSPHHPEAVSVARQLEEQGKGDRLTRMILSDEAPGDAVWPTAADLAEESTWKLAVEAVQGEDKGSPDRLRAWAGRTGSPVLRAALLETAAEALERGGDIEGALGILEGLRDEGEGSVALSRSLVRVLRKMLRWEELSRQLAQGGSDAGSPEEAAEHLAQRILVLEYALEEPEEAFDELVNLSQSLPDDAVVAWSRARLATRLGDWVSAIEGLDDLAGICPGDAPRVGLLAAEILLFALRDVEGAVQRLVDLAESDDSTVSFAARLYLADAYHRTGDLESLGQLLERELTSGDEIRKGLWIDEILEAGRSVYGNEAVGQLLEMLDVGGPRRALWDALLEGATAEPGQVGAAISSLAAGAEEGDLAPRCLMTAAMLDVGAPAAIPDLDPEDLGPDENVWHVADRISAAADPEIRAKVFARRLAIAGEGTPRRADWILELAEALEDKGEAGAALELIRESLTEFPEHPGLLESLAYLAGSAGEYVLAADAHGRLAGYYSSQDAKATQLARAARMMFEYLDDLPGAERVIQEAIRRSPSHEEAHAVLTDILREKGDEDALAKQIEERIDAQEERTQDDEALIELYEEQVDRLYAVDDLAGALEAVDKILFVAPERLSAHRTKIDLLMGMGKWEDSVEAMFEFNFACEEPVEIRSMTWQAAGVLAEEMEDPARAISELKELVEGGDDHPQTERQIATIARAAGMWEEAASALGRLALLIKDAEKRSEVLKEQAQILIEQMFEPEQAEEVLDKALQLDPGNIAAVKLALEFSDDEGRVKRLEEAKASLRSKGDEKPINPKIVTGLVEVAKLFGETAELEIHSGLLDVLLGNVSEEAPWDPPRPVAGAGAGALPRLIHRDDSGAPSDVILAAAPMAEEAFEGTEGFPPFGKSTLVHRKSDDPVRVWLAGWASFLGIDKFDLHRVGGDPRGSCPLPSGIPAVAVNPEIEAVDSPQTAFFLARSLWRSWRGLAGFQEGDAAMPVRWIMALTAAVLGDDAGLPLPTDRTLVDKAIKVMPRKVRKRLVDPCKALTALGPSEIRAWVQAVSYSADRFALLVCGSPSVVVPLVVEEAAGPAGVRRLLENPVDALGKVSRCVQLFRFVLSGDYLSLFGGAIERRGGG